MAASGGGHGGSGGWSGSHGATSEHGHYGKGGMPGGHHEKVSKLAHEKGIPFGTMLVGLEGWHTYAQHVNCGAHGMSGLTHLSFADAMMDAIAISVALGHGVSGHMGGFHAGSIGQVPGFSGWGGNDASDGDHGRWVNFPGVARDQYAITILRWPHRPCDVQKHIEQTAKRLGLTRYNPRAMDGNKEEDKTVRWLASNEPIGARADNKENPPNGWWNGALGKTHIWRQFYQNRPSMNPIFGRPKFETWRTYLAVSGATWYYDQTGDCETRISFSVCTKGMVQNRVWTFDWAQIKKERGSCEDLAACADSFLELNPAPLKSFEFRKRLTPQQLSVPQKTKLRIPATIVASVMPVPPSFVGADGVVRTDDGAVDPRN